MTGRLRGRRSRRAAGLLLALGICGGCGRDAPADTPTVLLAEGLVGDQPWRLEGRRLGGQPCLSLELVGLDRPPVRGCSVRRTPLRHLSPVTVPAGGRVLVFSAVEASARRVRLDGADGSIRIEPARQAPGFPARFFVVEVAAGEDPLTVRAFADGGRAVVG